MNDDTMDDDEKPAADKPLASDRAVPPEYDLESMCDRRDAAVRNPVVGRHAVSKADEQPGNAAPPEK